MNPQKRKELEKRRANLQGEFSILDLSKSLKRELTFLEQHSFPYKIIEPFTHLLWIRSNVPTRKRDGYHGIYDDFQLNVDDSKAKTTVEIHENDLKTNILQASINLLLSENTNLIVCYEGGTPEIEIPLNAFLIDPKLFLSRFETWILSSDKKWLIEYIAEQNKIRIFNVENSFPTLEILYTIKYD